MDGEQHAMAAQRCVVLVDDEGHAHRAGVFVVVDQKVAADMQLAIVFFVKTRRLLDIVVHRIFGDGQLVVLLDPALFFEGWRFQVDPDGAKAFKVCQGLDFFLNESTIG
ncbi:hypothetical protein SDC9_185775 [bioreactor metagenome]|uniref:Uncharacterized protein n=1 Tax=bioreactor metagenome TaxID=1076179 RepID=A0A645HGV4_9ZZZZ